MGFAWSSWVAQTSTLRVCEESGLPVEALLAADNAPPANSDLLFGVATDDVMFFTNGDPAVADRASTRLDEALSRRALVKHLGKDLPAATNQTCVGVDLVDGLRWEAPAAKLAFGFLGSLRLLEAATVCPQVASRWLGIHQWYDLLRRPLLSIFEDTYSFVRAEPALKAVPLPVAVRREILLAAVGCLHWNFDLTAPLSNIVGATDASTSFGLGAATIETDTATAWGLARHTARVMDYVDLAGGEPPPASVAAVGAPLQVPFKMESFSTLFSVPVRGGSHVNVLEGEALVLYLEWFLRASSRHGSRLVALLDSRVVIGAVAKGRSSSRQMNRICRRVAALVLGGSLQLFTVFVPTRQNPADAPSRGIRPARRTVQRRTCRIPRAHAELLALTRRLESASSRLFNDATFSSGSTSDTSSVY